MTIKIGVMRDGKIIGTGTPRELISMFGHAMEMSFTPPGDLDVIALERIASVSGISAVEGRLVVRGATELIVDVGAALSTFAAFVICGSLPLAPFVLGLTATTQATIILTSLAFFLIGSTKAKWSTQHWVWSGLETTLIGMSAAGIAYLVGYLLRGLTG